MEAQETLINDNTKLVKLTRHAIQGYILNVLGTDQIHDFCDVKRIAKVAKQTNFPTISGGGTQICMNIPDKNEYVDTQCLETFHVFLETIFDDGMVYKYLHDFVGGVRSARNVEGVVTFKTRKYKNKSKKNVSSHIRNDKYTKQTFIDTIIKRCKKFYNYNGKHELYNLKNICIENIRKIYNIYVTDIYRSNSKQNNCFSSFYNICKDHYNEQYDDSLDTEEDIGEYTGNLNSYAFDLSNSHEDTNTMDHVEETQDEMVVQNQSGGGPISENLKKFILQMAFRFCNISSNTTQVEKMKWKAWINKTNNLRFSNKDNWFYFEQLLLKYSSKIEDHSRDWVHELIENHELNKIKFLTGIRDENNLFCDYKPKKEENEPNSPPVKSIINNSANISSYWNDYILDTYPSFVDSQSSGKEYTEWGTYNCGFTSKLNNYFYLIKLDNPNITGITQNAIEIKFEKNHFIKTNSYTNFGVDSWKNVDACLALSKSFDKVYSVKKEKRQKTLSWDHLIREVEHKDAVKTTITNFYNFSLFKGIGDISQEMSSLIVNAGRETDTGRELVTSNTSIRNNFTDKYRFYLANDRLSANRYILTMNYGLDYSESIHPNNNINIKSYGGFFNVFGCKDYNFYLVEPDLSVPAVPVPSVLPAAPMDDVRASAAPMDDVRGGNNKTKKKRNTKKKHLKKSKTRKR